MSANTPALIALTNFETVLPKSMMAQQELVDFTAKVHSEADETHNNGANKDRIKTLFQRYAIKPTKIAKRAFESIEMASSGSDINKRTEFFGERARQIFAKFYPQNSENPDHLIHVTCTGYISPSPAQHLVNDNNWLGLTSVTHAYHMGCYAALPAIRMAEGFVAANEAKSPNANGPVDIVHTEMCGLHMNALDNTPEQVVVQSLFADGHIKYSAVPLSQAKRGFSVLNINELIVKDSQIDMSWIPASWGMKMTLSRDVPEKIGSSLRPFLEGLLKNTKYNLAGILKTAIFAVHPGGPKIIDSVQQVLELSDQQVAASKNVLNTRGNMSSATLPHVWKQLLEENIEPGRVVISLAFGPGLTVFGSVFEVI